MLQNRVARLEPFEKPYDAVDFSALKVVLLVAM